ncbi:dipeptidase PepE [Flavobacteriaceae bacterium]|jgi:dipeptidase E|nr:dipeptidase PepE [Flavobacteriaceae bacterium]MDC0478421.1 dipeptidase PepE [Flavobacteriaceae bacterium]
MKKMILASTSTIYGSTYLDYIKDEVKLLFSNSKKIIFIPYARPNGLTYEEYTEIASSFFITLGIKVNGIHEYKDLKKAITENDGIFIGGGNSFLLLKTLIDNDLINDLKEAINSGKPYLGTSAGINICGPSIGTSNDMPIVHPTSFKAMNIIPFNINPHFLDANTNNKHMGETRETRIKEFHFFNSQIVIGLREGSYLSIYGERIILKGNKSARVFELNKKPYEIEINFNLKNLL